MLNTKYKKDWDLNKVFMNNPLVSVIIPNYNHARFLNERIESVLNQTYQNFELIILDDCSPDNGASKSIIENYRSNPHISYIVYNDDNSGSTFRQWQKGMELAKGEIVWIAESDDACDETLLDVLVRGYVENDAVIAFCQSYLYDSEGNKKQYSYQKHLPRNIVLSGKDFISRYMIDRNSVANASSAIFSRSVAMSVDKEYIEMRGEGDWLFWIEVMEHGNVFYCSKELNYFRFQDHSTTSSLAVKGVGAIEHKIVFDYLVRCKYIPSRKVLKTKAAYISRLLQIDYFETKEIRKRVFDTWDKYGFYRVLLAIAKKIKRFVPRN